MGKWSEKARARRALYDQAVRNVPEEQAAGLMALYDAVRQDGALIKAGERRVWEGKLYRANVDLWDTKQNTPAAAPTLWTELKGAGDEYPQWIQPQGTAGMYATGDKVSHKGKKWISAVVNNVWEPGVYGWNEVK